MRRTFEHRPAAINRKTIVRCAAVLLLAAAEAQAQDDRAARKSAPAAADPTVADQAVPHIPNDLPLSVRQRVIPARRIVVSIPDRKLALIEDGRVVKTYSVAVGADVSPSPTGALTIAHRVTKPTYYHPGVVIPAGPANPLGTRWIGLSQPGYGIHGTNQPNSIGHNASHGCIRMRNRDVEDLFDRVRIGDAVELYAERTTEIAAIFGGAPYAPVRPLTVTADAAPAPASAVSSAIASAAGAGNRQ